MYKFDTKNKANRSRLTSARSERDIIAQYRKYKNYNEQFDRNKSIIYFGIININNKWSI